MTKRGNRFGDPKTQTFRLQLDREHTEAEVELVRYCFGCSDQEARRILSVRLTKERVAEVHGMLDAMRIERMEAAGHVFPVPDWLRRMRKK